MIQYKPHNNPGEPGIIYNISKLQMRKLRHRKVELVPPYPWSQSPFISKVPGPLPNLIQHLTKSEGA